MKCKAAEEIIFTDYIDGTLPASRLKEVEEHLAGCGHCREVVSQLKGMGLSFGKLRHEEPPRWLWSSIRSRIEADPAMGFMDFFRFPARFFAGHLKPALAAAAVVVLITGVLMTARLIQPADLSGTEYISSLVEIDDDEDYDGYDMGTAAENYFL